MSFEARKYDWATHSTKLPLKEGDYAGLAKAVSKGVSNVAGAVSSVRAARAAKNAKKAGAVSEQPEQLALGAGKVHPALSSRQGFKAIESGTSATSRAGHFQAGAANASPYNRAFEEPTTGAKPLEMGKPIRIDKGRDYAAPNPNAGKPDYPKSAEVKVDHYKTLGLKPGASKSDVQAAFKNLSKRYHPDISTIRGHASRYRRITEAYNALSNN